MSLPEGTGLETDTHGGPFRSGVVCSGHAEESGGRGGREGGVAVRANESTPPSTEYAHDGDNNKAEAEAEAEALSVLLLEPPPPPPPSAVSSAADLEEEDAEAEKAATSARAVVVVREAKAECFPSCMDS